MHSLFASTGQKNTQDLEAPLKNNSITIMGW
jgi:hypothetical protein